MLAGPAAKGVMVPFLLSQAQHVPSCSDVTTQSSFFPGRRKGVEGRSWGDGETHIIFGGDAFALFSHGGQFLVFNREK